MTSFISYEPRCEKTGLRGFRPGPTQTGLYSHRRLLETWDFRFRKKRNCTTCIRVSKTKALISFAVTAKLICVFVFAYAKAGLLYHHIQLFIRNKHVKNDGNTISGLSFIKVLL